MANVERPILRGQYAKRVCEVCGRSSEEIICEPCRVKIRGEALILKKHKDRGEV
jgi:hypothetical protein